jgi:hypothetical protein
VPSIATTEKINDSSATVTHDPAVTGFLKVFSIHQQKYHIASQNIYVSLVDYESA